MKEHTLRVARTARYFARATGASFEEVWFVLHGYGHLASTFLSEFEPIASPSRALVAPEALSRFYRRGTTDGVGASWMTREARNEEIADYVHYLDAVYDDVVHNLKPPAPRLVVLGFSQGGAAAARWTCLGRSPISRLILWGSDVPPDLDLELLRKRSAEEPIELVVGTSDEFVTQERVEREVQRLDENAVNYRLVRFDGGHRIDAPTLQRLAANGT